MDDNKYEKQYNNLNLLDIKIYDELFPINIKSNAGLLIHNNKFVGFKQIEKNMYEAVVPGTYDYMVRVLLNDDYSLEKCICDCAYYHNTSKYCKHVYALLNKIITEKNNCVIQKKYDENIFMLGKELDKLKNIIEKSEKIIKNKSFTKGWIVSVYEHMENDFKKSNGIKLNGMRSRDSILLLNNSLYLLDEAKKDLKKIEIELKDDYNFIIDNESDIKEKNSCNVDYFENNQKNDIYTSQNCGNNLQISTTQKHSSKKKNIIEKLMNFFKK